MLVARLHRGRIHHRRASSTLPMCDPFPASVQGQGMQYVREPCVHVTGISLSILFLIIHDLNTAINREASAVT